MCPAVRFARLPFGRCRCGGGGEVILVVDVGRPGTSLSIFAVILDQ